MIPIWKHHVQLYSFIKNVIQNSVIVSTKILDWIYVKLKLGRNEFGEDCIYIYIYIYNIVYQTIN